MKKQSGITLISLIVTIVIILIITGTTVYTSMDRFKVNNVQKMNNDIELLNDKINNYYVQYGGLPVLKDSSNNAIKYTFSNIDFEKNKNDNENYQIIDLLAIGNISLNFGKEGYENPNSSNDVYIINEKTHMVYYVKGVENIDGIIYHTKDIKSELNVDTLPPTKPEINIISKENASFTEVEIIPGKDSWSGVAQTEYTLITVNSVGTKNTQTKKITERTVIKIDSGDEYTVKAITTDNAGNKSENELVIKNIDTKVGDFVEYNVAYTDMYINKDFTITNGWRLLDYTKNKNGTYSNVKLISTGIPAKLYYNYNQPNDEWWVKDETNLSKFREILGNNYNFYSESNNDYIALKAAAGMYYNFRNIKCRYDSDEKDSNGNTIYNKGWYTSITNKSITYGVNNGNETEAKNIFLADGATSVMLLTLPEVNKAIGRQNDIDSTNNIIDPTGADGLFVLQNLKNVENMADKTYNDGYYWFSSPYPGDVNCLTYVGYDGMVNFSNNNYNGVRPVISFDSNVIFTKSENSNYLKISNLL